MNIKILIGSIIALCILVGVSFTSVVGYRSVAFDVKESPLFNIRCSRAIDKESEELRCAYVGKGDTIDLNIPDKDEKTALIKEVIDRISKMDDTTLEKFINYLIFLIKKDKQVNSVTPDKIREMLNLIKYYDKPKPIFEDDTKYKYSNESYVYPTACCFTYYGGIWGLIICLLTPLGALIFLMYSICLMISDIFQLTLWIDCR